MIDPNKIKLEKIPVPGSHDSVKYNDHRVIYDGEVCPYVEMTGRDRGRFADCRTRLNECPLGSAALAGTSFPIDRHMTSKALGFDRPTANSLDGVSDRDFALEFLSSALLSGATVLLVS